MKPKISVILCSYNRADRIGRCIDALLAQSLHKKDYEIIVVNDGSNDGTGNTLSTYKNIRVTTNAPNQGLAGSRNVGARMARAEIIAFTDDDCVPSKDWLKNLLKHYNNSKIMGVGGKIIPYRTNHWLLKFYDLNNPLAHMPLSFNSSSSIFFAIKEYVKRSTSLHYLPDRSIRLFMLIGANMSMRRTVFDITGGFDPKLKIGGEEEEFWKRFYEIEPKAKLCYAPEAIIKHDYVPEFKDARRRSYSYGIGAARNFIKDPKRLPVIYPFPLLVIISLLLMLFSPYSLILSIVLGLILYPGWVKVALIKKKPQYVLYAYVQMFLELIHDYGFMRGYIQLKAQSKAAVDVSY
jgi:glycosyltransferase involved in cell wall biosynthesis